MPANKGKEEPEGDATTSQSIAVEEKSKFQSPSSAPTTNVDNLEKQLLEKVGPASSGTEFIAVSA